MDKSGILNLIDQKISQKISTLENLISETRESNNDTKSSMGDKYETGREMLQQEINNLQIQLDEAKKQEDSLTKILLKNSETAEKGALIKTGKGCFFISISASEIIFNDANGISQRIEKIW